MNGAEITTLVNKCLLHLWFFFITFVNSRYYICEHYYICERYYICGRYRDAHGTCVACVQRTYNALPLCACHSLPTFSQKNVADVASAENAENVRT